MPIIMQYGVNWSITGDKVTIFDDCARELEKAMDGEIASPTRKEMLAAMIFDLKSDNIEQFRVGPRFAIDLCIEGVISGLDLTKAPEVAGESILVTGNIVGTSFKMEIVPKATQDLEVFYLDGSSETHFQWILNRQHSVDLDQSLAEIREILSP